MDPTLFEDYAPAAAPAKPQHGDDAPELVPYLHFAWLCNVLAGVAAPLGDSYETFAVDGDAQGSSSAPPDGPDDDPLVPYGAFKFVAEAVGALDEDEPFVYGAPPTPGPPAAAERQSLAPYLDGLDDDAEAALLPFPFLAFAALAHLLFYDRELSLTGASFSYPGVEAATGDVAAEPLWNVLNVFALPLHAVRFALAPLNGSRRGASLKDKKKSQSSEDLASLAAQKFFGGGKKQKSRTVRLRTAL